MSFKMFPAMKILLVVILAVSYCVAENGSSVRIVGEKNATIEQFPYQVALSINYHPIGGIIISEKWVMTVAHIFGNPCICAESNVTRNLESDVTIYAGSTYYKSGSVHNMVKKVLHMGFTYVRGTPINDIALLQVYPEFTYSNKIRPARLPNKYEDVDEHSSVVMSGWQRVKKDGPVSHRLRSVEVDVITNKRCHMLFNPSQILPSMFCTMMKHGPCFQEYGGPVLTQDRVLIGFVSWGVSCAGINLPGIHTKVSHYRDWISEVTGV